MVDWSDLTRDQRWHLLRASVVVEGRSITLYEEVHPQKLLGNPKVHRCFLQRLAQVAPLGCKAIVMTDAGFQASWFKMSVNKGGNSLEGFAAASACSCKRTAHGFQRASYTGAPVGKCGIEGLDIACKAIRSACVSR